MKTHCRFLHRIVFALLVLLVYSGMAQAAFKGEQLKPAVETDIDVMKKSVVRIGVYVNSEWRHYGTGFVIGDGSYIVTDWHVASPIAKGIPEAIILPDSKAVPLRLVSKSELKDLAILAVDYKLDKKPAAFLGSDVFEGYTDVIVIGYPEAADFVEKSWVTGPPSVTKGHITKITSMQNGVLLYQIDAVVHPGNSGSPVFNKAGSVIGVISFGLKNTPGINYALSANDIIEELVKVGITPEIRFNEPVPGT